ncbi:SAV_915 family protein [Nocardia sp. NPDC051030]|uniref:SAV_915 family protein n=1 Tax=Nocardia sp. NPDC051030 TaxID=3155162 RepID=UPI003448C3FF
MDEERETCVVPVHVSRRLEATVLQTGRLPQGGRIGIAFSDPDHLIAAMGSRQGWIRLSPTALRAMLRPLGVSNIQFDPILIGPDLPLTTDCPRTHATVAA